MTYGVDRHRSPTPIYMRPFRQTLGAATYKIAVLNILQGNVRYSGGHSDLFDTAYGAVLLAKAWPARGTLPAGCS
jgi:hypothetical protein